MKKKMNVLVVDDHPIHRAGVIGLLKTIPFITKCMEASNGLEALDIIQTKKVDVVLLDLDMPKMNGIKTLEVMHDLLPEQTIPKIIIMSVDDNKSTVLKCYHLGIDGFINKASSLKELNQLFNLLQENETYYCTSVKNSLYKYLIEKDNNINQVSTSDITLNQIEVQLLRYVCMQYTITELADQMNRSEDGIKSVRYRLYKKLGVTNMIGALIFGIEHNYVTVSEIKSGLIKNNDYQI